MSKKNTETPAETPSANISLAELGQRFARNRKPAESPPGKPEGASESGAAGEMAGQSEQAAAEDQQPDLLQSADDDSAARVSGEEGDANDDDGSAGAAEAAAAAGDAGEGEDDGQPPDRQAKVNAKMQKRIDRLTAQREELRAQNAELAERFGRENEELRQRLARYETARPQNDPVERAVAKSREVGEIDGQIEAYERFVDWAGDNPEGGIWEEDGKQHNLDGQSVKSLRSTAERELRRLAARRESRLESMRSQFQAKRDAAHAEAVRLYPWLSNKQSPEFQEALAILRERPELLQLPDVELRVGREVTGLRLEREALKKAKTAPKAKPAAAPTPVVTTPSAAAPRQGSRPTNEVRAAEESYQQSGRVSDLSKLLAQRKLARQAPDG